MSCAVPSVLPPPRELERLLSRPLRRTDLQNISDKMITVPSITAASVILGVANVIRINLLKVSRREKDWQFAVLLLIGVAVMTLLGAVLPTILTQLLAGKEAIQLGALWPRRDLTYVDDTVEGFLRAAHASDAVGRTIQLGTGRDVAVGELAELAMRVLNRSARLEAKDERLRPASSEVNQLLSDPLLAQEVLGWRPTVTLEEGVRRTAEWLDDYLAQYKPEQYHH